MNLSGSRGRLTALTRDILLSWEETKSHWHDVRSEEFEKRFMAELAAHSSRAASVMEELDKVLHKARKDCE
jgi:hypothetical protein